MRWTWQISLIHRLRNCVMPTAGCCSLAAWTSVCGNSFARERGTSLYHAGGTRQLALAMPWHCAVDMTTSRRTIGTLQQCLPLVSHRATCSPITLHAQPIPVHVVANRMSTGVLTVCAFLHCRDPSPTRSRTALASP